MIKHWTIRKKLAFLILVTGICAVLLFQFLWNQRYRVWDVMCHFPSISWDYKDLINTLREEAPKYDVPKNEEDYDAVKKIQPLLNLADEYTGIAIYGLEDGYYRAGNIPEITMHPVSRTFFSLLYNMTHGESEDLIDVPIEFKNETASVLIQSYHISKIVIPYFFISLGFSGLFFLSVILFFVGRKMRIISELKDEVQRMSGGDLTHAVRDFGGDEIGILAQELNGLRTALDSNIRQEAESRQANQDLITAMSHDLRTPLTILNGYLEVLKLKRKPEHQEEYIDRCLKKTEDIKEMTDRMFEYALVYEQSETLNPVLLSDAFLFDCLRENCDFIHLAGFGVNLSLPEPSGKILGDETLVKRIFNNLFSNILKYGDKKQAVQVIVAAQQQNLTVTIINLVKTDFSGVESNHIGLRSVERMMEMISGELYVLEENEVYTVKATFPIQ